MPESITILVYAVLAAASPVTLIATLVVLGTKDARVNGMAFAAGFILGQAAGLGIPLIVGLIVTDVGDSGNASDWFELALGVLMLLAALRMRRKRAEPIPDESRAAALLVRLERVNLKTAFSIGIPLGIGVKRLLIAILAASTIALEATSHAAEFQQAAFYVIVASILVWLPVTAYFIVGEPADEWVKVSKRWLLANQREVSFYLASIFGVCFTVDAAIKLAT